VIIAPPLLFSTSSFFVPLSQRHFMLKGLPVAVLVLVKTGDSL